MVQRGQLEQYLCGVLRLAGRLKNTALTTAILLFLSHSGAPPLPPPPTPPEGARKTPRAASLAEAADGVAEDGNGTDGARIFRHFRSDLQMDRLAGSKMAGGGEAATAWDVLGWWRYHSAITIHSGMPPHGRFTLGFELALTDSRATPNRPCTERKPQSSSAEAWAWIGGAGPATQKWRPARLVATGHPHTVSLQKPTLIASTTSHAPTVKITTQHERASVSCAGDHHERCVTALTTVTAV
eukprot:SAG11_NODE_206_length_12389_cov_11.831192_10_plen_241_part_00